MPFFTLSKINTVIKIRNNGNNNTYCPRAFKKYICGKKTAILCTNKYDTFLYFFLINCLDNWILNGNNNNNNHIVIIIATINIALLHDI